jgi:crotonobetainyl-CoA:carnitine CoA-transferase CaiB-like acyl-CoA transferase
MIQGLVGFMPVQGEPGHPEPIRSLVVDKVAAMSAALATLAALQARHSNGGAGQRVEVKMLDAFAAFMLPERMNNYTFQSPEAADLPMVDLSRVTCAISTRDGHVTGLIFQKPQFEGICTALQREDIRTDPRFSTPSGRITNIVALTDALQESIRSMSTADFLKLARAHDIPFAPVNDIDGFFTDPQVQHNKSYVDFEDADFGTLRHLNAFASFGTTPVSVNRRAPTYGEQTRQVLTEYGYDSDALNRLEGEGTIATGVEQAAVPGRSA